MHIQEAMDNARTHTLKLSTETRAAIVAVREAVDCVQRTSEGMEMRAHQAAGEVRTLIRRCVTEMVFSISIHDTFVLQIYHQSRRT